MDYKDENMWLMLGDCLERMKEIPDGSVDMVLTDPPYGTTACKWDSIIPLEPMWEQLKRVIKPNGAIVLFGSEPFSSALRMSNIKNYKYDWIWEKESPSNFFQAKYCPLSKTENISVFGEFGINSGSKKIGTYNPQGIKIVNKEKVTSNYADSYLGKAHKSSLKKGVKYVQKFENYPTRIIKINRDKNALHPTQKPVALMEYLIKTYTNEGETVLDFTMGSGSTGVACANTNRRFIGVELDQDYFDIAKQRIAEIEARLASYGFKDNLLAEVKALKAEKESMAEEYSQRLSHEIDDYYNAWANHQVEMEQLKNNSPKPKRRGMC